MCERQCEPYTPPGAITGTFAGYFIFEDAGFFAPSALTYAQHVDDLISENGVQCNPYNNPRDNTGWPSRCLVPCVQYGLLDEPHFNYTLTTEYLTIPHRPLCPCFNGSVYQMDREYEGSKGAFMSECKPCKPEHLNGRSVPHCNFLPLFAWMWSMPTCISCRSNLCCTGGLLGYKRGTLPAIP
eukprot:scaffold178044_cov21-Tisochrysis_lutea.AAC.2